MASSGGTVAEKLHEDDVTGERVSKTELKRRQKARAQQAKKDEKAKTAGKQPAEGPSEAKESELTPNQYHEIRCRAILAKSTAAPEYIPFPFTSQPAPEFDYLKKFVEKYEHLGTGEALKDDDVRLMGRVSTKRASGSGLYFYDLTNNDKTIQIMCQREEHATDDAFNDVHSMIRRGDTIEIVGFPGRTRPKSRDVGELSAFARGVTLLAPCLQMMPSEHHGFKDLEARYRNRHVDLIMNSSTRDVLNGRADLIRFVRRFLEDRDFKEHETPILEGSASGANAKPFKTYYEAADQEVHLRIAPELRLKTLVVGGLERVFELGRQFRNEGADATHNPEFTTCEFYQAYSDVYGVIDLTEELVSSLVFFLKGTYETTYHTQDGQTFEVNWKKPWRRVKMIPALEQAIGEKFPPADQLQKPETCEFLKGVLQKMKLECAEPRTTSRMIDRMVGEYIEGTCISPTWITGHPEIMSPLAKWDRDVAGLCERAEAFVCKNEIVNCYTELNDPFEQRRRFEEQARQKAQGDDEAQDINEEFIRVLEYGLPPTGGCGIGIDRLVMFILDKSNIREVLPFPFMKKDAEEKDVGKKPADNSS